MGHRLITAPLAAPVSLAEVKADLRIEHSDDDVLLQQLINEATAFVDGPLRFMARALMPQVWELLLDAFPPAEIRLPVAPVQNIVSVAYDDTAGAEQIIDETEYELDNTNEPPWLFPLAGGWSVTTLDAFNSVRVRYTAGYVDAATVPGPIKQAIRLMVQQAYDGTETQPRADDLLSQFRVFL